MRRVPRHRRPTGPTAPVLVSWSTAVCRAVVAAVLVALGGLVLLAVAPRLAGFQGHVVVSGSMAPRLAEGDVVLTRAVSPQQLQPGQVLLFPDPDRPDRLLLHRLVSFDARGDLVTRGDANQSNDSVAVSPGSVLGQAQLRVPHVGLPAYWRVQGEWGRVALAAGLLAAATVFAVRRSRSSGDPAGHRAGRPAGHRAGHRSDGLRVDLRDRLLLTVDARAR